MISEDDLARRATFPENLDIRSIAAHLATKVMIQAHEEGVKVSKEFILTSNIFESGPMPTP